MIRVVDHVLYGMDQEVSAWVAERVPVLAGRAAAGDGASAALGVVRGERIIAGIVFRNYRSGVDIEVDLAAEDPRWAFPVTLRRLFRYPFVQLGLPRITCIVSAANARCRELCEGRPGKPGLGWKHEGTARRAYDGTNDALIFGMLREDCRFLTKD